MDDDAGRERWLAASGKSPYRCDPHSLPNPWYWTIEDFMIDPLGFLRRYCLPDDVFEAMPGDKLYPTRREAEMALYAVRDGFDATRGKGAKL